MTLVAVNQRLIEDFENVTLYFGEAKSTHVNHYASYKFLPLGVGDNPIEEITFNRSVDAGRSERFTRQEPFGVVLGQPHNSKRDTLGVDDEKGVLEP